MSLFIGYQLHKTHLLPPISFLYHIASDNNISLIYPYCIQYLNITLCVREGIYLYWVNLEELKHCCGERDPFSVPQVYQNYVNVTVTLDRRCIWQGIDIFVGCHKPTSTESHWTWVVRNCCERCFSHLSITYHANKNMLQESSALSTILQAHFTAILLRSCIHAIARIYCVLLNNNDDNKTRNLFINGSIHSLCNGILASIF